MQAAINLTLSYALRHLHIILQNITAATVLMLVAISAGMTIFAGSTDPYALRYAMIFTGINCNDDIFITRNVHISSDAVSTLI